MPIGCAPARHIFMPLYCAGLWLAVNITPAWPSRPDEVELSVEARPIMITSAPAAVAPAAKAPARSGELGRMS